MTFFPDERAAELRDLFFESAAEILQAMNESGLALEDRPGDKESLRSVRRAVHTLKGDSAACGFRELSELAHELEDVLTPELTQQHAGLIRRFQARVSRLSVLRSGILLLPRHCREKRPISISAWLSQLPCLGV